MYICKEQIGATAQIGRSNALEEAAENIWMEYSGAGIRRVYRSKGI